MAIKPYANDMESTAIGDLSIENGTVVISVSGNLDLSRDKVGLKRAVVLKGIIDAIVDTLEAANDLPEKVEVPVTPSKQVPNPFS